MFQLTPLTTPILIPCVCSNTYTGVTKGTMINKTIEDVSNENSCRYPLGEFNDPPKYFCGGVRYGNSPYCKVHLELCTHKKEVDLPSKS